MNEPIENINYFSRNFVGILDEFMPAEWCEKTITYFENMDAAGFTTDRQKYQGAKAIEKKDDSLCAFENELVFAGTRELHQEFIERFWKYGYKPYSDEFDILTKLASHSIWGQKIQRTKPGGGYHVWHCEHGDPSTSRRVLAYILYLNDVEEGGETEFLYTPMRVKPKTGRLVIFPAGFTHTHRGNPPISGDKYIVTGWVEF